MDNARHCFIFAAKYSVGAVALLLAVGALFVSAAFCANRTSLAFGLSNPYDAFVFGLYLFGFGGAIFGAVICYLDRNGKW